MRAMIIIAAVAALLGLLLGVAAGFWLWHHEPQNTQETFKPARVQVDGSVSLTRIPTAPADAGPPAHIIPKGAKETARAHVRVRPKPVPPSGDHIEQPLGMACACEPIDLDLSLIHGKGGTGLIASADGAEIDASASTYMPMLDPSPPQYRNFILATNEPGSESYAGLLGRRYLGNRLGVALGAAKHEGEPIRALVGLEFNF